MPEKYTSFHFSSDDEQVVVDEIDRARSTCRSSHGVGVARAVTHRCIIIFWVATSASGWATRRAPCGGPCVAVHTIRKGKVLLPRPGVAVDSVNNSRSCLPAARVDGDYGRSRSQTTQRHACRLLRRSLVSSLGSCYRSPATTSCDDVARPATNRSPCHSASHLSASPHMAMTCKYPRS